MKISFAIPDLRAGGAERVMSFLINEMSERGYDVSVICLYENNVFYKIPDNVRIVQIGRWNWSNRLIRKHKNIRDLFRTFEVMKVLKKEKPDVVVSFLTNMIIHTSWACLFLNIPHISCERNSPENKPEFPRKRKKRDAAFSISKGCVFQTENAQNYFKKSIQNKSTIIPNPIMLSCEPSVTIENREKTIVSVGRYTEQKNQKLLLDGFKLFHDKHPSYRLVLYGTDYGLKDKLISYAKQLDIHKYTAFHDAVTNIHEEIRNSSVFVLPSNYEGMPNALAEAVALGIPCIATNCPTGGCAKILDGGKRGILIPCDNINETLNALNLLIEDDSLWLRYSNEGKKIMQEQNKSAIADLWETYIIKVAKGDVNVRTRIRNSENRKISCKNR